MAISDDFEVNIPCRIISYKGSQPYTIQEVYNAIVTSEYAKEIKKALGESSLETVIKRFKWDMVERAAAFDKELCERLAKPHK